MSRIEAQAASQLGDLARTGHPRDRGEQTRAAAAHSQVEGVLAAREVGAEDLDSAAAALQKVVEASAGRDLDFQIHEDTHDVVVEITDRQTKEVIRQIPAEEVLRLREHLDELVGIIIDRQA